MRKSLLIIAVLILILANMTSCIGIGSGALFDNPDEYTGTKGNASEGVEVSTDPLMMTGAYLKTIKGIEQIEVNTVKKINEDWNKYKGTENDSLTAGLNGGIKYCDIYLGIIGGYVVLCNTDKKAPSGSAIVSGDIKSHYISVAGYEFVLVDRTMILYKDGKFETNILKLYEDRKLTDENIRTIHRRYLEYIRKYDPDYAYLDKEPINEEELALINAAWLKKTGNLYAETLEETRIGKNYCFGKFGEDIVFRVTTKEATELFDYPVPGAAITFFDFGNEFEIWVLHDGELVELNDAYNQGLFTQKELASMVAYHDHFSALDGQMVNLY